MNTALVPMSLSKISSSMLSAQTTRMGPRSRRRGRLKIHHFSVSSDSFLPLTTR